MTLPMSISLKVVSKAALCCAATRRSATVRRNRLMGTTSSADAVDLVAADCGDGSCGGGEVEGTASCRGIGAFFGSGTGFASCSPSPRRDLLLTEGVSALLSDFAPAG